MKEEHQMLSLIHLISAKDDLIFVDSKKLKGLKLWYSPAKDLSIQRKRSTCFYFLNFI